MDGLFDQNNQEVDFLAELTKPGGQFDKTKYASDQDLLKALAKKAIHGDRAITLKNTEMDEMRQDYLRLREENVAKAKLDEYATRLEQLAQRPVDDKTRTQSETQPNLSMDDIKTFFSTELAQREAKKREDDNMAIAEKRVRERLGDNASAAIAERMKSLNLSQEDVKFLARKSPEAVLNALGLNQTTQSSWNPPGSNVRSDNFKPTNEVRDALFYEKLRKEDPKEYFNEKTSVRRLKDMEHPDFLKRYNEQQTARAFSN